MLGQIIKVTGIFDFEEFKNYLIAGIPETKAALIEKNKKALDIGYNY